MDIISEKQRNLLMMSEMIKEHEFKNLYSYLQKNKKVSFQDVNTVPKLGDLTAYIDDLIKECQLEWEPSKTQPVNDLGERYEKYYKRCELCGNRPIRYEYTIVNQLNLKQIVVGSECVKEYGAHMSKKFRDRKQAARRLYLEGEMPGIRSYVEAGWKYPRKFEMIIPSDLENEWQSLINK